MTTNSLRAASETNQSIQRAVAILWATARIPGGIRLSDLARAVSLPYPTVFRIVQTLEHERLLARVPGTRRLMLGRALVELTAGFLPRDQLAAAGRAHIEVLADRLGEAVELSAVVNAHAADAGNATEVLIRIEAAYLLQASSIRGSVPLHATSVGKILLAHRSDTALAKILAAPLPPSTSGTITDPAVLRSQVELARQSGVAECADELEDGVSAVSTGIHDAAGQLVGILNVDGPTRRLGPARRREIAQLMLDAASAIETDLQAPDGPAVAPADGSAPAQPPASRPTRAARNGRRMRRSETE